VQKIKESDSVSFGFNAATDSTSTSSPTGVIDPTKVVHARAANAASVSSLMITTEALIADKPEKKDAAGAVVAAAAWAAVGGHRPAQSEPERRDIDDEDVGLTEATAAPPWYARVPASVRRRAQKIREVVRLVLG
jgi:hypothetical protein